MMKRSRPREYSELSTHLAFIESIILYSYPHHMFLYLDKTFWEAHFRAYWYMLKCKFKHKDKHLKYFPMFVWLYVFIIVIPLMFPGLFILLSWWEDDLGMGSGLSRCVGGVYELLLFFVVYRPLARLFLSKYYDIVKFDLYYISSDM